MARTAAVLCVAMIILCGMPAALGVEISLISGGGTVTVSSRAVPIVTSIQSLSKASIELRTTTQNLNLVNILFQGPQVAQGFSQIVSAVGQAVPMLGNVGNAGPLSDADAGAVVTILKEFVAIHQQLLSVVIGKKGLLALFPFAEPIRQALVALEAAVDSFAFALIDLIPTRASDGESARNMLDKSLDQTIQTYTNTGLGVDVGGIVNEVGNTVGGGNGGLLGLGNLIGRKLLVAH